MEADITNQIEGLQPVKERGVTPYPYILFNKSPEQLRRLGACGGKANARNQRARRAVVLTPLPPATPRPVPRGNRHPSYYCPRCPVPLAARCRKTCFPQPRGSPWNSVLGNQRQRKATKSNQDDLNQLQPSLPKARWEHLGSHSCHSGFLDFGSGRATPTIRAKPLSNWTSHRDFPVSSNLSLASRWQNRWPAFS